MSARILDTPDGIITVENTGMAIIGESRWEHVAMTFTANGHRPFSIGYFKTGLLDAARAWLNGLGASISTRIKP